MKHILYRTLILTAFLSPIARAQTLYVSMDGSHDTVNKFNTWARAATNIPSAIGAADPDDLILVSNGVYNLAEQISGDFIDVNKRVTIRGFSTNREEVVITGGGVKRGFRLQDPACIGAVLDRLTISNCLGTITGGGIVMARDAPRAATITNVLFIENRAARGAGGYIVGATVTDCAFINNTSPDPVSYQWSGGGAIFTPNLGGTVIRNSIFISNRAENVVASDNDGYGGAIMLRETCGNPPDDPNPRIEHCIFIHNHAERHGGAIADESSSPASYTHVINSTVISNTTDGDGGGIRVAGLGRLVIDGGEYRDNTAAGSGGGIMLLGTSARYTAISNAMIAGNRASGGGALCVNTGWSNVIENCAIIGNHATNGGGGGIYIISSSQGPPEGHSGPIVRNCLITNNAATTSGGGVNALGRGGRIINCLLAGNTASTVGGGIYVYRMHERGGYVTASTIAGNTAAYGGGIHLGDMPYSVSNWFTNTIVFNNQSLDDPSRPDIWHRAGADGVTQLSRFLYCCAPAEAGLPAENNNITNNPNFMNFNANNYRLTKGSMCIDTGTNQPWMTEALDLNGKPRLDRYSGQVDRGCYEYISGGSMFFFW